MSLKMVCSSQNLGEKIKAFNLSLEVFILFILTKIQIILERKKSLQKKNRKIIDSCLKVQDCCFEIIIFQINQRLLQKTKFLSSITMSYPHKILSRFLEVKFYLMIISDNQKEQIKKLDKIRLFMGKHGSYKTRPILFTTQENELATIE